MVTHSSTIAWKIPWTEEPGRLQSMGSLRLVRTERLHFHFSPSCIGEGNGNPLQCCCLENPRDEGAWWAAIYGVAQSQTRVKQLSSSSSIHIQPVMPKLSTDKHPHIPTSHPFRCTPVNKTLTPYCKLTFLFFLKYILADSFKFEIIFSQNLLLLLSFIFGNYVVLIKLHLYFYI